MEKYLTVEDISERLSIKPSTIYKWIEKGFFQAHKMGRLVRVKESDLVAWLERTKLPSAIPELKAMQDTNPGQIPDV